MEQTDIKTKITEKLVVVLLITLFTIILWGGAQIINSFTKEKTDPKVDKYVQPLPRTYDQSVINELVERKNSEPSTN